jgi:predicted unusual protein kinase regulating ubiquinone biosynthesis (AarF/ABC1/UbiB family)
VKKLVEMIHQFADAREIDYSSVKHIFETCGAVIKNEQDLQEMKQHVDRYLQNFDQQHLKKIEHRFKIVDGGVNTRQEGYTHYASRRGE